MRSGTGLYRKSRLTSSREMPSSYFSALLLMRRHAHSDHYTNLSKSWKEGPIYCSETTANLIIHMLGVEPQWVVSLQVLLEMAFTYSHPAWLAR